MLAANVAGDTAFHDAIRQEVLDIGIDSYFGNTIAMLCLITDDGGWMVPETSGVTGDVNADGTFDVTDVVVLQKWLLAEPDLELKNWKAGDYDANGELDSYDLALMKRALLGTSFSQQL